MGPGDDAAVLPDGWAWSVDTSVEGVHFDARATPEDVGWKAVAVSVSDVAAMGAAPVWLMLAISLRADGDEAFVDGLARGVGAAAERWGLTLIGGDTTRCVGARVITSIVAGPCGPRPLTRAGGRPGDRIWITGTPGLAGLGWSTPDPPAAALRALHRPEPPVAFAVALASAGLASAAMDLSDGLATDLPRLCAASGCGAEVDPAALPGAPGVSLRHQVHGGDDYELLFTAPPHASGAILALAHTHGVRVTPIGSLTAAGGAQLLGLNWPEPLFAHFRSDP